MAFGVTAGLEAPPTEKKPNKQAPEMLMITDDSVFNSIPCLFHPLGSGINSTATRHFPKLNFISGT